MKDHLRTLKELFGRLRKARITARPTKCLLGASRMEFLGHEVRGDVITPSRDNLEKVRNTKKQVRSCFLGLVGYYRDHTPAFVKISAPLTDLLKKGKSKHIGIKRFNLYLAGRRFTLQTDHKTLKYLKDVAYQNDRVFRWAVAVQEYSFRVEDIPGKENVGADFLSRTGYSC